MIKTIDLRQKIFGRLLVIRRSSHDNTGRILWACLCDCGNTIKVRGGDLRGGNTRSCGCLRKEKNQDRFTKHGHAKRFSKTKIYHTWTSMTKRCTNPNTIRYARYGGRGISVCKRWEKFENFLADMGEPPTDKHVIDRIDNNGDYNPDNCRWVTYVESNRNTKQNHMLTHEGTTMCASAWAEKTGIKYPTLMSRLRRGWSVGRSLGTQTCGDLV